MNNIALPVDIWNIVSYELHAKKLHSLAVCNKALNCLMSKNQGLELYNRIADCKVKLISWNYCECRKVLERRDFNETIDTSIKILEYHCTNSITLTYRDIFSLQAWTNAVLKNGTLRSFLDNNGTYEQFINLEKRINIQNFENTQF